MTKEIEYDNAAARLYYILKNAQDIQKSNNTPLGDVWSLVFSVENKDQAELLHIHSRLMSLIKEVRQEVVSAGLNRNVHLKHFDTIEATFAKSHLRTPWNEFVSKITSEAMHDLLTTALHIGEHNNVRELDDQKLSEIRTAIDDLEKAVKNDSELESVLKRMFFEQVDHLRRAVNEYQIGGYEAMKKEFESVVGSIAVYQDTYRRGKGTEAANKFKNVVITIAAILSIANNLACLGDLGVALIPDTTQPLSDHAGNGLGKHERNELDERD